MRIVLEGRMERKRWKWWCWIGWWTKGAELHT